MRLDPPALTAEAGGLGEDEDVRVLVEDPRTDGGDLFVGEGYGGAVGHRACLREPPSPVSPQRSTPFFAVIQAYQMKKTQAPPMTICIGHIGPMASIPSDRTKA